jgi:hypothetical protein
MMMMLALASCASQPNAQRLPNAATSSGVTTGQPRAMEDDPAATQITSAEFRNENAPKAAPAPKR